MSTELQATVDALVQKGKGILAADESGPTIAKRFKAIGVESTEENRRAWRSLILATPGLGQYISGVILYEETLAPARRRRRAAAATGRAAGHRAGHQGRCRQDPAGAGAGRRDHAGPGRARAAPRRLQAAGRALRQVARGLQRLRHAAEPGARSRPTPKRWRATRRSARQQDVVPIVEPEVLIDGDHTLARCAEVTQAVLHEVFDALHRHRVALEHMLLKPSMVVPGKAHAQQATPAEVAARDAARAAAHGAGGGAEHQFPVRRPVAGRGDGQSRRDEPARRRSPGI